MHWGEHLGTHRDALAFARQAPVEVTIEHRPRITGVSSMKLVRGAIHRFLFVVYIALRQLLLKLGILMRPQP